MDDLQSGVDKIPEMVSNANFMLNQLFKNLKTSFDYLEIVKTNHLYSLMNYDWLTIGQFTYKLVEMEKELKMLNLHSVNASCQIEFPKKEKNLPKNSSDYINKYEHYSYQMGRVKAEKSEIKLNEWKSLITYPTYIEPTAGAPLATPNLLHPISIVESALLKKSEIEEINPNLNESINKYNVKTEVYFPYSNIDAIMNKPKIGV